MTLPRCPSSKDVVQNRRHRLREGWWRRRRDLRRHSLRSNDHSKCDSEKQLNLTMLVRFVSHGLPYSKPVSHESRSCMIPVGDSGIEAEVDIYRLIVNVSKSTPKSSSYSLPPSTSLHPSYNPTMTTFTPFHPSPRSCPFCAISALYPPLHPYRTSPDSPQWTPQNLPYQQNPSYLLLSTPDAIAFLDIMPLTKGHVLVVPRRHVVKMGELGAEEAGKVSES